MCIVSFSPASLYPAMVDRCRYYLHSGVAQKRHGHGCIIHTAGQCNMMKVSHLGNISLIILVPFGGFHKWCCPNSWMVYKGQSISKWMISWYPLSKPPLKCGVLHSPRHKGGTTPCQPPPPSAPAHPALYLAGRLRGNASNAV